MVQKPKIQYIGQFYVHGSEARALEVEQPKKAKTKLPLAKLETIEKIYVDPVALAAIGVAVILLVVMLFGAVQLQKDWASYQQMADYVTELKTENARLDQNYRAGYDLEDIEMKALAMGLVPGSELKSMAVTITIPEKAPVMTWDQKVVRFWNELWA